MKMGQLAVRVFGLIVLVGAVMAQEKPDLTGQVIDDDGKPVADASVFIYTAGPRVGPGYI